MKFLILTNHSYMLWQFRRELIEALLTRSEVVIGTPFGERIDEFEAMGCRMIETAVDRRGINPFKDLGLYRTYRKLLKHTFLYSANDPPSSLIKAVKFIPVAVSMVLSCIGYVIDDVSDRES